MFVWSYSCVENRVGVLAAPLPFIVDIQVLWPVNASELDVIIAVITPLKSFLLLVRVECHRYAKVAALAITIHQAGSQHKLEEVL